MVKLKELLLYRITGSLEDLKIKTFDNLISLEAGLKKINNKLI